MSLREILVPLRGDGKGEGVLNHAIMLAQRFNAHIDAVHCRPKPTDMLSFDIRIPRGLREQIIESASGAADTDEEYLRALFDKYCQSHDLAICEETPWPTDKTTARWREETGNMPSVVGNIARVYDVTVLARPDPDRKLGYRTLRAAILQAGRPALLCPPEQTTQSVAANPVIAWNGSTETARSVGAAMPLLLRAGKALIISVDSGDRLDGPDAHALAGHLRAHGLAVEVNIIKSAGRHVSSAILDAAKSVHSDCLITGAFGHSQKLEFIMGSATQSLVDTATMPLLMMH